MTEPADEPGYRLPDIEIVDEEPPAHFVAAAKEAFADIEAGRSVVYMSDADFLDRLDPARVLRRGRSRPPRRSLVIYPSTPKDSAMPAESDEAPDETVTVEFTVRVTASVREWADMFDIEPTKDAVGAFAAHYYYSGFVFGDLQTTANSEITSKVL